MIITCGECDSGFVLDGSLLKPGGSKVRCSSCGNIFVAYPPAPADTPEVETFPAPPKSSTQQTPAKASATTSIAPIENDPDLTKAVKKIVEEELSFSKEELMFGEPPSDKTKEVKPEKIDEIDEIDETDEIPQIEIDAKIEEEDEILDFSDFELDIDESDIPVSSSQDLTIEDDELDFSDLELELDADSQAKGNNKADAFSDEEELDFSDLELELDADSQAKDNNRADAFSDEEELDFSDLELELDADPEKEQKTEANDNIENLELSFEDNPDDETVMIEEEFDFSDLDAELNDDSLTTSGETPAEIEDLELDLNLDSDEPETLAIMDEDLDFSDFELEPEENGDKEELDFSDLANMLDKEVPADESLTIDENIELDLELELDEDLALELDDNQAEAEAIDEELDFSDLENILDDVDAISEPLVDNTQEEDIELELDMEDDSDLEMELSSDSLDSGDESFDFSDVEAMLEADDDLDEGEELELDLDSNIDDLDGINFADEGDIKLELSVDQPELSDNVEDILGNDAINNEEDMAYSSEKTMKMDNRKINTKKIKVKPKRKARGKGKLFLKVFLFIIFLILISIFVLLSRGKINNTTGFLLPGIPPVETVREKLIQADLPFISDWVRIIDKDPKGILDLTTSNINGDYISNEIAGKLFVIKGKIQNNYPDTRNSISLKCSLINAEGKTVKSEIVYAGNFISDETLKTIDIAAIHKILQQRLGENNINAKVRPGQKLPFIVAFSNLNEEFTEFSVQPESSAQGAAIK